MFGTKRIWKKVSALSWFFILTLAALSSAWGAEVSGRVSETGSGGLPGIEVRLWFSTADGYAIAHSTTTDANGDYRFPSVSEGTYKLDSQMVYLPGGGSNNWVRTWYDVETPVNDGRTFEEADEIEVSATGTNLFDLHMDEGGGLDGRVLIDAVATGGINVRVQRKDDARVYLHRVTEQQSPLTGKFFFRGLPAGNYSVIVHDPEGIKGTSVFEGPFVVAAGLNGYTGDLSPANLPTDPNEPNNSFYRSTSIDVSGVRQFPQVVWESSSTTIAPKTEDTDFFCFNMVAGDRFEIRTETPLTVDGQEISHPWMDPVLGFFRITEYPLYKDNNSGPGGLNAKIDTGELTEDGEFCVAVSTSGDLDDFDGVGQTVAGAYTLHIEMANRVPRLSVTYGDGTPTPQPPGLIGVNENDTLEFQLAFSDPDRNALTVGATLFDYEGNEITQGLEWSENLESGTATLTWTLDEAASMGSPYEFRFIADDSALSAMVQVNVRVYGTNLAPTTPVLVSPELGSEVATSTPFLKLANSSDPDDDELLYSFEIYYDENPLADPNAVIQQIGLAPENPSGETSWQPAELPENTWIYWRARADDRQLSNSFSAWTLPGRFFVNSTNDAPVPPEILEPAFNEVIYSRNVTLEAQNTVDPEGDDVTVVFQVASDDLFMDIVTESPEMEQDTLSGRTLWALDTKLDWGTTYYARCMGIDSHGAVGEASHTVRFSIAPNIVPDAPTLGEPFDSQCEEYIYRFARPEAFEVVNVIDPGEDTVYYHLQVFDFDDLPDYPTTVPVVDALYASALSPAETTSLPVDPELFEENAHYRIRVRAWDEYGYTPFSECDFFINLTDEPPLPVTVLSPEEGAVFPTSTTAVTVVVQNTSDPDQHLFDDEDGVKISYCYDHEPFPNGCDNGNLSWTDIPQSSALTEESTSFIIGGLARGSRVYLKVCGLHRSCGETTERAFRVNDNLPPARPTIFFPREGYITDVLRISTFGHSNGDPDEDFVELGQYELSNQEDFGTVLASSSWMEREWVETMNDWGFYWEPPITLVYNQDYWIRFRTRDLPPSGISPSESEWSVVHFSTVEANSPPLPPEILAPLDGELLEGLTLVAEARPLSDPNEDEINGLFFELSDDETFETSLQNSGWLTERTPEGTLQWNITGLEIGTRYWIRVKSRDVGWLDESAWSKVGFLSRSTNSAPTTPVWITPPPDQGDSFRSFPVEIIWQSSTDADGDKIFYTVELSRIVDFRNGSVVSLVEDMDDNEFPGPFKTFILTEDDAGAIQDLPFYLRVRARDELGSQSDWAYTRTLINTSNRAPELVDVQVLPTPAYSHNDLIATATSIDPDGDLLNGSWRWWRFTEGIWTEHGNTSQVLASSQTLPGDLWKVDYTVDDGLRTIGPVESSLIEVLDYCEDFNPCTHNIWTPDGCSNRAFDNGSQCDVDGKDGMCTDGVCLTNRGPACNKPFDISVGIPHRDHWLVNSAFLGKECLGAERIGPDFFFQFNPLADITYRVTIETTTGTSAIALAYLETCNLLPGCSDHAQTTEGETSVSMDISSGDAEPLLFLATIEDTGLYDNLPIRVDVQPICTTDEDCYDGIDCTAETCTAEGVCSYLPNDETCSDDIYCNGAERCLPFVGCTSSDEVDCNDGIDCTTDACDEEAQQCTHEANDALCDDTFDCNGVETCELSTGCIRGDAPDCSDDVECTVDRCEETSSGPSCVHIPFHYSCDDHEMCTEDICLPGEDGGCINIDRPDDTGCTSGSLTSLTPGVCRTGTCIVNCTTDEECNDAIPCTMDRCKTDHTCENVPSHALCDNDRTCDGIEQCVPLIGCISGQSIDCDDGIACTEDECSESLNRCVHYPRDLACSNGKSCDGREICDRETGCQTISVPDCNDNIGCTLDGCMESPTGPLCLHEVENTNLCDDDKRCTFDRCNPDSGCENVDIPDGASCDDGDQCNGIDTCYSGVCRAGDPPDCEDDDPCTMTGCSASRGCFGMVAEDWSSCGENLACFDGICTPIHETDNCEDAKTLEIGEEWIVQSYTAHSYADPHEYECLLPPVSGSDFFFRMELEAGGNGYEITIVPVNGDSMDLALVLWEQNCPGDEGECFKAYRHEGTQLLAVLPPLTRPLTLVGQVVIPSPNLQSKSDLSILIETSQAEIDGDDDADNDLDVEPIEQESSENPSEIGTENEWETDQEKTKKKNDDFLGLGCGKCPPPIEGAGMVLMVLGLAFVRRFRESF